MALITTAKYAKPFINSPISHNTTIDFCGRKYSATSSRKTDIEKHPSKISEKIINDIEKITPQSLKDTIDLTEMPFFSADALYVHSVEISGGHPHFRDMAEVLLITAAKEGSLPALNDLGQLIVDNAPILNQDGIQKWNPCLGIEFLEEAARCGNKNALMNLGLHYLGGNSVEQNIEKALDYYYRAEESGHSEAQGIINFIKLFILTDSNPEKAAKFFVEFQKTTSAIKHNFTRE